MNNNKITIYLRDLVGGGVERMMLNLANELIEKGYRVDIVLERSEGEFIDKIPKQARLIHLNPKDTVSSQSSSANLRPRRLWRRVLSAVWQWFLKATNTGVKYDALRLVMATLRQVKLTPGNAYRFHRYVVRLPYLYHSNQITMNLCRYLQEVQPETVITGLEEQNFRLVIARQLTGSKARIILSVRNHLTTFFPLYYNKPRHKHYLWAIKQLYSMADQVVAVAKEIQQDLIDNFSVPAEKTTVIYNPVVNQELWQQIDEPTLDDDWLLGGTPVVLGVGRLHPQKGFDTLVHAFSKVVVEKASRLIILGTGPEQESLHNLTNALGLSEFVRFPGFRENPFPYMKRCSVFVLSSVNEGLPGVLIQAMACGCPVVATDCRSGPREILEGGAIGKLVPVGDQEAMAQAMLDALDRQQDTDKLKIRAQYFNSDRATKQYLNLIESIKYDK